MDIWALMAVNATRTPFGASGDVIGMSDPEPICMQMTVSVSWQAAKNGSQNRE